MKKSSYFFLFFYAWLILAIIVQSIWNLFGFSWESLFSNLERLEQFFFYIVVLTFSLAIIMVVLVKLVEVRTLVHVQRNLAQLLDGQELKETPYPIVNKSFVQLSHKLMVMTDQLQKSENQVLQQEEAVIEKERKRIARDLHDTVSQELFAANMILSGVVNQVDSLSSETLGRQLSSVGDILTTAQKDLRILLLHLRPTELEGRSLVQGMEVILNELAEKSDIEVHFHQQVSHLPKQIEEHIFRIAQEIISNTLRHAKASILEVYLYQTAHELQLKMSDNGIGFEREGLNELSYGLKNMEDRVHDMAGTIKILTAPKQGVAIDIRIPLLEGV